MNEKEQRPAVARILEAHLALAHLQVQPIKLKVWLPGGTTFPEVGGMRRATAFACFGHRAHVAGEAEWFTYPHW